MATSRVQLRELLGQDPEAFIRQSLLDQLAVLHVMTDQELLGENPESLHDFRVAVRTLRTRLKFYEPYFKNSAKIAGWLRELKWLDAQIQPLRELEVQIELFDEITQDTLQKFASKATKHKALTKRFLALRVELARPLFATRQKMQFALMSERKHRLLTVVKTGLLLAEIKPKKVLTLEATLMAKLSKRTDRLQQLTSNPNFANQNFKQLHAARLNFKRTRYLAEAMGLASKPFADSQTLLGEINDLANLASWIRAKTAMQARLRKPISLVEENIQAKILASRQNLLAVSG